MDSLSEHSSTQPPAPPTLPSADDSSWAWATESGHKRLVRLRGYLDAGRPVWWRRSGFRRDPFREVEPKWHVFAGRTRSDDPGSRWAFTWHALCGYRYEPTEILFGPCDFKVVAPKGDTRCKYCAKTLTAIKASTSSQLADPIGTAAVTQTAGTPID